MKAGKRKVEDLWLRENTADRKSFSPPKTQREKHFIETAGCAERKERIPGSVKNVRKRQGWRYRARCKPNR